MSYLLPFLYRLPAVAIAVTLHEYVKALASARLGDIKPKKDGRLTLNPFVHMDILGTICLFFCGLGWGRPVETSSKYYFNKRNGTLIVYIMPSVVNMITGLLAAFCLLFIVNSPFYVQASVIIAVIKSVLYQIAVINVSMALFNIIPVYPLDGAKVLSLFLKPYSVVKMKQYEKIFQLILVIGIASGAFSMLISPFIDVLFKFAY